MKKTLERYDKICNEFAQKFLKDLYDEDDYNYYWVGDDIGGVLMWGDFFLNMENIVNYFKYNYTPDSFFRWYYQWMGDDEPRYNMKSWKYYKGFNF